MIGLSIVIPVYESDMSLNSLTGSILTVMQDTQMSYEIIFVDDGSKNEKTWTTLSDLQKQFPEVVRCFRLMRNFGRPSALLCGFSKVNGAWVLMMDDDLEHDPNNIPLFLKYRDHDVVIARFENRNHSIFKIIVSSIKGWFDYKLIGRPKGIQNSSYKLIKRTLIEEINQMNLSNPFISGLLFSQTDDIINIDVEHGRRLHGKSGYTIRKMIKQFSNLIFNNSSFLLRLISYWGISFSFISILLSVIYLSKYFRDGIAIKGWTSMMLLVLFTSGLILFSLGVFGEYFIRIIRISENRPSYVIKESRDTSGKV